MSAKNIPEEKKEYLEVQPQDKEAENSQNKSPKESPVNNKISEIKEKHPESNEESKKIERLKRFGLPLKKEEINIDTNKIEKSTEVPDANDEVMKQRKERFKDLIEENAKEKEKKQGKIIEGSRGRIMKYDNKNNGRGNINYSGSRDRRRDKGYERDRYPQHRIRGGRRNGGYRK